MRRRAGAAPCWLLAAGALACAPGGADDGRPDGAGTDDGGPLDASDGGPPDGLEGLVGIDLSPTAAEVAWRDGIAGRQEFRVDGRFADGSSRDVTDRATFTVLSPLLGRMDGSTFEASGLAAGRTTLRAAVGPFSGFADLTVRVERTVIGDGVPAEAPGWFAGATEEPARAPTIVYPPEGTLVPPNIGTMDVHFTDTAGNDLFEIAFRSDEMDIRVYASASGTGWITLAPEDWRVVGESVRGGAARVTVRGMSRGSPAAAGTSAARSLRVAEANVEGGIYYWAASARGVYRHDFGAAGGTAERVYGASDAGGRCVACHALSRDGTRMTVTMDGGDGPSTVIDVASRTPAVPFDTVQWNFSAYSPDGRRLVTSRRGTLTLRDGTNATVLGTVPTPGFATMPDFSPRGDAVAFVDVGSPSGGDDWHFTAGAIAVVPFDRGTDSFGASRTVVPRAAANAYYPAFSPDGEWIIYNVSGEDAYDDPTADLRVVRADGSEGPVDLAAVNETGDLTNSWPRWAPFEMTEGGWSLFWFTFSSKRAFGVRLPAGARPQLWMAAFVPSDRGEPPSVFPAFRLPFQDIDTSNHIAQWTEVVVPIE